MGTPAQLEPPAEAAEPGAAPVAPAAPAPPEETRSHVRRYLKARNWKSTPTSADKGEPRESPARPSGDPYRDAFAAWSAYAKEVQEQGGERVD